MAKKKAASVAKPAPKAEAGRRKEASFETALRNIERDLVLGPAKPFSSLSSFSRYAESLPELSAQDEREIALAYRQVAKEEGPDDPNAQKLAGALLKCTLRHVARLAYKYRGYRLSEMDLIQEGMIGLMKAIKRFDPDKKGRSNKTKDGRNKPKKTARLATYATFWIQAQMNEHVLKFYSGYGKIATTEAQRKLFFKLRSETARLGRRLDIEEAGQIAARHDVKLADVLEMEKRFLPPVPYESPDDDDELDSSPSATLVADDGDHPETAVIQASEKNRQAQVLAEAYKRLDARECEVFMARHLAEEGQKRMLRELAADLGVSIERVRQIDKQAFRKVQEYVLEHADPDAS